MTGHRNPEESVARDDVELEQTEGKHGEFRSPDPQPRRVRSEDGNRGRKGEGRHATVEDQDQHPSAADQEDRQGQACSDVRSDVQPEHDLKSGQSEGGEPSGSSEDAEESGELSSRGEPSVDRSPEGVLEGVISELTPQRREDLEDILVSLVESSVATSWSAPLPEATDFYKYAPQDRERMMSWNDAGTSDESRRQDKLVDARIAEAKAGPRRAIFIVLVCLMLAAVAAFWMKSLGTAALFLSPPLIMFAQQLIASLGNGSSPTNGG